MPEIAIRVENIAKRYRIGEREHHQMLRGVLAGALSAPFRNLRSGLSRFAQASQVPRDPTDGNGDQHIWVLKDVSFEVKQGEVVGIVGRNGAGKTTLLKILSRITSPTAGYAEVHGRVGSLLEVGTGFHAELTGRENVYLNGAILGMKRVEIDDKFDEIVSFAEVERFIDTPVKRFSSGMYLRLAFAVAAHLEPEILLVDEVLAVGDAAFQRKCLGKMGDVAKAGRTILFVSHNMGAVNRLCTEVTWLDEGRVRMIGAPDTVIGAYLSSEDMARGERCWDEPPRAPGNGTMRLRAVRVLNAARRVSAALDIRESFWVEIEYEVSRVLSSVRVAFRLVAMDGTVVFTSADSQDGALDGRPRAAGRYVSRCKIPGNFLNHGQYALTVTADIPFVEILLLEENVVSFQVEQTGGVSGAEQWPGVICPELAWNVELVEEALPDRDHGTG